MCGILPHQTYGFHEKCMQETNKIFIEILNKRFNYYTHDDHNNHGKTNILMVKCTHKAVM